MTTIATAALRVFVTTRQDAEASNAEITRAATQIRAASQPMASVRTASALAPSGCFRYAGCSTQPNNGANHGIDPKRWCHYVLLARGSGPQKQPT